MTCPRDTVTCAAQRGLYPARIVCVLQARGITAGGSLYQGVARVPSSEPSQMGYIFERQKILPLTLGGPLKPGRTGIVAWSTARSDQDAGVSVESVRLAVDGLHRSVFKAVVLSNIRNGSGNSRAEEPVWNQSGSSRAE